MPATNPDMRIRSDMESRKILKALPVLILTGGKSSRMGCCRAIPTINKKALVPWSAGLQTALSVSERQFLPLVPCGLLNFTAPAWESTECHL